MYFPKLQPILGKTSPILGDPSLIYRTEHQPSSLYSIDITKRAPIYMDNIELTDKGSPRIDSTVLP